MSNCYFILLGTTLLLFYITRADLIKTVSYIAKSVELNQPRLIHRALRLHSFVRKHVDGAVLRTAIVKFFPRRWENLDFILAAVGKIPVAVAAPIESPQTPSPDGMEVVEDRPVVAPVTSNGRSAADILPEVEVFLLTLVVTCLLRHELNEDAAEFSSYLVSRIRSFNRRSLDVLSSKAYFYFSLAYEKINRLENIRSTLLALYRTACLHHDDLVQAVLVNLLLRNYMHYNLIEQAQALAAKTTFPESASNNQYCRYLYYIGRLQAIQLEYSDAYGKLMMSARKAPQELAEGFARTVYKLAVIVQLLMGEIPERSLFNQDSLRTALRPYLGLTQAVRAGDVVQFEAFVLRNAEVFRRDQNFTLVQRLGHNVLKTGLRKISLSYVRISLKDIADKLHLPSAKSAEYVCAKAIRSDE